MKVNVYSLNGKPTKKISLPDIFKERYRPDIIQRAVVASQTARKQVWGTSKEAGKKTSAESWGAGFGVAMVPRVKGRRHPRAAQAAFVPQAVGGRKAHPPKSEKKLREQINKKERWLAIRSAIAATANSDLVARRGHVVTDVLELPLVVEDKLERLRKTREVQVALEKLGVWPDVWRAKEKSKVRAGKGKRRGRKYKKAKGPLIVVGEDRGIRLGARNLPGVDVVRVKNLGIELLAPGIHAGRLTVWTESAIEKLASGFSS